MGEWGWSKGSGTDAFTCSNSCSGAETGWCPGGSGRGCRMAPPCSLGAAWGVLVFWHPMGFRGRLEGPGSPFLSVGEERRHGLQRGVGWFSSQATAAWERECAGAYGGGSRWWDSPRRWRQKSAREPGAGREAVQHRGCSRLELGKPWGLCGDKGWAGGGLPRPGAHSIAQQRDLRDAHAVSPSASCWYPSPMLTTVLSSGLPTGVLSLSFISRYPLILYLQRP